MLRHRITVVFITLTAALMLASCVAVDGNIGGKPAVLVDKQVHRPWLPQYHIEPQNAPIKPLNAVLVPFRMRQGYKNAKLISEELTRAFWQRWLQDKVFPTLAFAEGIQWRGPRTRVRIPQGADILIGGEFTQLAFGGTVGETAVALRIDMYDAVTGNLIWSISHAGSIDPGRVKDFIVADVKARMPSSPEYAIMQSLAGDMAGAIKRWNYGQPEEDPNAESPVSE